MVSELMHAGAECIVAGPKKIWEDDWFQTNFENRTGVIESVTLKRENTELRVVGYFIG